MSAPSSRRQSKRDSVAPVQPPDKRAIARQLMAKEKAKKELEQQRKQERLNRERQKQLEQLHFDSVIVPSVFRVQAFIHWFNAARERAALLLVARTRVAAARELQRVLRGRGGRAITAAKKCQKEAELRAYLAEQLRQLQRLKSAECLQRAVRCFWAKTRVSARRVEVDNRAAVADRHQTAKFIQTQIRCWLARRAAQAAATARLLGEEHALVERLEAVERATITREWYSSLLDIVPKNAKWPVEAPPPPRALVSDRLPETQTLTVRGKRGPRTLPRSQVELLVVERQELAQMEEMQRAEVRREWTLRLQDLAQQEHFHRSHTSLHSAARRGNDTASLSYWLSWLEEMKFNFDIDLELDIPTQRKLEHLLALEVDGREQVRVEENAAFRLHETAGLQAQQEAKAAEVDRRRGLNWRVSALFGEKGIVEYERKHAALDAQKSVHNILRPEILAEHKSEPRAAVRKRKGRELVPLGLARELLPALIDHYSVVPSNQDTTATISFHSSTRFSLVHRSTDSVGTQGGVFSQRVTDTSSVTSAVEQLELPAIESPTVKSPNRRATAANRFSTAPIQADALPTLLPVPPPPLGNVTLDRLLLRSTLIIDPKPPKGRPGNAAAPRSPIATPPTTAGSTVTMAGMVAPTPPRRQHRKAYDLSPTVRMLRGYAGAGEN